MSKCSKTSYFYFCCRSEFWHVPGASGMVPRYPSSFFLKCSTFCFSPSLPFSISVKLAVILLNNCRPVMKELPFLKDITCTSDALLFCFGVTFTFVVGLQWISSPGFGTSCITILQMQMMAYCSLCFINYIYLASLAVHGSWLL